MKKLPRIIGGDEKTKQRKVCKWCTGRSRQRRKEEETGCRITDCCYQDADKGDDKIGKQTRHKRKLPWIAIDRSFQGSFQFVKRTRVQGLKSWRGLTSVLGLLFAACFMKQDVVECFEEISHVGKKRVFFVGIEIIKFVFLNFV